MSDLIRLGLIGAGAFARFVAHALEAAPTARLVAVTDLDGRRAADLARLTSARVAPHVGDLLGAADIDAVLIASPPSTHCELSVRALRAGKHVFCEKPAALSLAEIAKVRAAVSASGLVYTANHVIHNNPLVTALRELRRDAVLTEATRFVFENDAGDSDLGEDHWFWVPKLSGGILLEHAVHFFDVARFLIDSPELETQAMSHARDSGAVDTVVATVRHENGCLATHAHSFTHANQAERQWMRIDFGNAEAILSGWIPLELRLDAWTDESGVAALSRLAAEFPRAAAAAGFGDDARLGAGLSRRRVTPSDFRSHGWTRHLPEHARLHLSLGSPRDKTLVYAASVRSVVSDFVAAIHGTIERPRVDLEVASAAVAVACAAQRAVESGRTEPVARP